MAAPVGSLAGRAAVSVRKAALATCGGSLATRAAHKTVADVEVELIRHGEIE